MIGIVADNIKNDSRNYILFRELNKLSLEHDCYLFVNSLQALPLKNKFAILNQYHALQHRGILISTSLINTQIVKNALMASDKYFYVWNPEWLNLSNFGSYQLDNVLNNPEIKLIARSTSHYDMLSKLFKAPEGVVENWNYKSLEQLLNE